MKLRPTMLDDQLAAIEAVLTAVAQRQAVQRFRADLAAARFHLHRPAVPPLVAILGGTGTGKSTLLNRLLDAELTAANYRRTFTAGPIAVAADVSHIPSGWLGIQHTAIDPAALPARGQPDQLAVITTAHDITKNVTLIDTPDLDGDQPPHHAQADRVFRWADAVLFLVTPEKYQMTELLPYYRLTERYGIASFHVMNKVEEQAVVDDYAAQIGQPVFIVPRNDAAYCAPPEMSLPALGAAISRLTIQHDPEKTSKRVADLMDRLRDQIIEPLTAQRRQVDQLVQWLHQMETPPPGVDVSPLTQQLQRRLQHRSVLYLMGPGRVVERVRQVPAVLARLPRTTWDLFRTGRLGGNSGDLPRDIDRENLDFHAALVEQFVVTQTRIDDALRSNPTAAAWIEQNDGDYRATKIDAQLAGKIADEEIARLRQWLETRWNATPRDTAVIQRLLKVVPGGKKLTQWSEAAPYILAVVVAAHHAVFGPIDLMILGGFSLATWLSEKLSNQVSAQARSTNRAISDRFAELAHQQISRTCGWLESQVPSQPELRKLTALAESVAEGTANDRIPTTNK